MVRKGLQYNRDRVYGASEQEEIPLAIEEQKWGFKKGDIEGTLKNGRGGIKNLTPNGSC